MVISVVCVCVCMYNVQCACISSAVTWICFMQHLFVEALKHFTQTLIALRYFPMTLHRFRFFRKSEQDEGDCPSAGWPVWKPDWPKVLGGPTTSCSISPWNIISLEQNNYLKERQNGQTGSRWSATSTASSPMAPTQGSFLSSLRGSMSITMRWRYWL